MSEKSHHSICCWSFNAGKGGFVPADIRPAWNADNLDALGVIRIIQDNIVPRMPENVVLGFEMHYDYEFNEKNASEIADALRTSDISLAMVTPGAHAHFAYGGMASLDPAERNRSEAFAKKTVELAYGPLKKAWHRDLMLAPSLVIWNGSFGYDLATLGIMQMYKNLQQGLAGLCQYEAELGGDLFIAIEPKPNEGHPAMLIPTVASAILLWYRLEEEYGITRNKKGVNKEFGHSEMIGLDHVYDTVEEIDAGSLVHMHLNSQGYNDGIILGGPGKYDIDHGVRINGMNIVIAGLLRQAGFKRWKGHDMQPRPYDNEQQGIDRVVRSILSWEACECATREIDARLLMDHFAKRQTAIVEDMMRHAVMQAQRYFDQMY